MLVAAAPFRNPAVFAKMIATLDEVSDGRMIAGLGAGWHQPEFDAFGIPFDHRVSRFEEAVHIIKPLLRDGRVDFTGRFYQAPNCELIPRGPRPGWSAAVAGWLPSPHARHRGAPRRYVEHRLACRARQQRASDWTPCARHANATAATPPRST